MFYVFDLDGTVIDSSHRQCSLPDGTLDLVHWRENSTPEKVQADSLLPLAGILRRNYYRKDGPKILVCTARVFGEPDYWYLAENDLPCHEILSRPEGCTLQDFVLKDIQLRLYAQRQGLDWVHFASNTLMFEDAPGTLAHLRSIGINCIDAIGYNAILAGMPSSYDDSEDDEQAFDSLEDEEEEGQPMSRDRAIALTRIKAAAARRR